MSRVPRHFPIWDACNTSMEILWQRIEDYFENNYPHFKNRLYSDYYRGADQNWEENEVVDVITFGDTLRKTFQTGNLTQRDLRFWSICDTHRKMQNELLYQGESVVNLIERDKIFSSQDSDEVDFSRPLDLVFAGRLSRQKNIEMLILFNEKLNEAGVKSRLHLFGDYDDRYHEHLGRQSIRPYEKEIIELVGRCQHKPHFYGRVGPEEWLEESFEQPIAISLSTFMSEDFGVSLAQAREKGWPVICSEFGGHKDIRGNQIALIPSFLCQGALLPEEVKLLLIERAVQFFLDENFKLYDPSIGPDHGENDLEPISLEEVDVARRGLAREVGSSLYWLNLDSLASFADTDNGGLLVRRCLDFLETSPQFGEILFIHGKDFEAADVLRLKDEVSQLELHTKIHFVHENYLNYKDKIILLKRARKAVALPSTRKKTKDFLNQLFP